MRVDMLASRYDARHIGGFHQVDQMPQTRCICATQPHRQPESTPAAMRRADNADQKRQHETRRSRRQNIVTAPDSV